MLGVGTCGADGPIAFGGPAEIISIAGITGALVVNVDKKVQLHLHNRSWTSSAGSQGCCQQRDKKRWRIAG